MELKRAKEIFESKDTYPVQLDGQPVWIEDIDETNKMAKVQIGNRPTNTVTVNVEQLKEPGK
ncbi:H-type small acid-soluble spore protein [Paenibacillus sediminis]|uniref:Small acid-soluble spore protein H (Minor) n=1 Tax=Paenibacillus sediminis TaxID=664909 RepID=A0ABS4H4C9_9BACL|nr:H-type small acid-soluble spore protein [Paenibacillus sediminis]MBP1937398.1 small acid-soluble spore protein H (minor) [Paenibacillus sediminis]